MTPQRLIKIVEHYKQRLGHIKPCRAPKEWSPTEDMILPHVRWMLDEIPTLIEQGRAHKAQRWLGFIQGVFWRHHVFSIEQMKSHNRSDEDENQGSFKTFEEWSADAIVPEGARRWAREAWNIASDVTREKCARVADGMASYYRLAADQHLPVEPSPIVARDRAEVCERVAKFIRWEK